MINDKQKRLSRLAVAIGEHFGPQPLAAMDVCLPTAIWEQCKSLLHKTERASRRGWQLAAGQLRRDLQLAIGRLRDELLVLDHRLKPSADENRRASAADIYADLVVLNEEFEEVSFDRRGHTISVTTEPIELEGVYLGPYRIELEWSEGSYRVISLDANPAASSDSVTHPHVQDEVVCEGEARRPIENALKQGRLLDFFVIVANLLRTYNSGSPYVALDQWDGAVECADCGTRGSDADEWWSCEKCEEKLCQECYFTCADCGETRCSQCVRSCSACLDHFCEDFMDHCAACGKRICRNCLNDQERCLDCHEQYTEEHETEEGEEEYQYSTDCQYAPLAEAHAPVQSDRLGQAAIPA